MLHALIGTLFSLAAVLPIAAQSQITTAVINGTVVDPSGAVLPGVDVEVRNTDTNLARTLTTDREGRVAGLQLPPGRYGENLNVPGFAMPDMEKVQSPREKPCN